MSTVRLFSFRINNVAYKNVQPYLIELNQERVNKWVGWIYSLFGKEVTKQRWVIKFSYRDQNLDFKIDSLYFDSKDLAEHWYYFIFEAVFLEKNTTLPPSSPKKPAPPPPKPKKLPEKLKKPSDHLKVVKNEPEKTNE